MNGAPPNPINGTRSLELAAEDADRFEHMPQRLARLERPQAIDVSGRSDGMFDRRPFAFDEIEVEAERSEGEQEIGKQDGGVHLDHVHRLQRDGNREVRLTADLEQRVRSRNAR